MVTISPGNLEFLDFATCFSLLELKEKGVRICQANMFCFLLKILEELLFALPNMESITKWPLELSEMKT